MIEFLEFLVSFGFGAMAGYFIGFWGKNEIISFKDKEIGLKNAEIELLRKNEDRLKKQIAQMEINAEATMILRRCLDSRLS